MKSSFGHSNIRSALSAIISRGERGGWQILPKVEVKFENYILVPDLAGWKKERLPELPETNWCDIPPDWICEVLSPSSMRTDRIKKMTKYAEFGVFYAWIAHSIDRILDVYRLESGKWTLLTTACENDKLKAEPFQEIEIDLKHLRW